MKKLLTLIFSAMIVFSLAMPVIAQDAPASPDTTSKPKKEKKAKKEKKSKKKKSDDAMK
jgi:hypothetical protein